MQRVALSSLFRAKLGVLADALDFDSKCDGSLPLEDILKPDPKLRKLLEDIDRSKTRVWALTNAYQSVSVWTARYVESPTPTVPHSTPNASYTSSVSRIRSKA